MTFDKILVPLDGSLLAEAALPKAVELIGSNAKATLMSTQGRNGFRRRIRGSVAESVLRGSRTPVFLITANAPRGEAPAGPAGAREREAAHV